MKTREMREVTQFFNSIWAALISRVAAAAMVVSIFAASVWGRQLERSFSTFIPLIAVVGVFFVLVITYAISRKSFYLYRVRGLPTAVLALIRTAFPVAILVAVCENIIILPLERVHFIKFSLLAIFIFASGLLNSPNRNFLAAVGCGALIGVSDEVLQLFVPNRFFDWRDILMNCLAALLGAWTALAYARQSA